MTGAGGAAGSGKAGMSKVSTEALGRLTRHDHPGTRRAGLRRGVVALTFIVLVLAGWGVWELVG